MKRFYQNSFLALVSEYVADGMMYGGGYLMARTLPAVEFGCLMAALAFAQVIMVIVDSGMGQIASRQIAQSPVLDRSWVAMVFTWRYLLIIAAALATLGVGKVVLPTGAYQAAVRLTPAFLLFGMVDFAAWVLKGMQRIPAYCAALISSRGLFLIASLIALSIVPPRLSHVLVGYEIAAVLGFLLALRTVWRHTGRFYLARPDRTFFTQFLPHVYRYAPILIAGTLMVRLDLMWVAKLCGETQAGLYGCAAYAMDALQLVPLAIYGVCLPAFSAAHDSQELRALWRIPFLGLLSLALLIALWVPVVSSSLFVFLFGQRYAMSGVYFQTLAWSCIPYYANMLFWAVLLSRNQYKALGFSMAGGILTEWLLIVACVPHQGPIAAAWARVAGMTVAHLVCVCGVSRMKVISWRTDWAQPVLAGSASLLTAVLWAGRAPWSGALAGTMLLACFLIQLAFPRRLSLRALVKFCHFFIYGFRLGRRLSDKLAIIYMFLRWRLIVFVSDAFRTALPLPETIRIVFHKRELEIHIADDTSFPYLFYEIFIGQDYRLDLPRAPKCIIDAGAHYGMASLFYACLYPDAIIHALEPCANNFRHLALNTRRYPNIHIHNLGLFSQSGQKRLYLAGSSGEHTLVVPEGPYEDVQTTTLDEFLAEQGISHVDVLKIDIEGAEDEVLSSTRSLGTLDRIVGELHFDRIDWARLQSVLSEGFAIECLPISETRAVFRATSHEVQPA